MDIDEAINNSSKVHYNYNRLEIPENDLKTLIHAAANAPTKYDEEHYSIRVFTDQKVIYDIYKDCTKSFWSFIKMKKIIRSCLLKIKISCIDKMIKCQ